MTKVRHLLLAVIGAAVAVLSGAVAAPAPAGSAALDLPQPLSILFLGSDPRMDPQYAAEMQAAGINYAQCSYYEPLTYPFMRRFNVVVVDKFPVAMAEYHLFGQRMVPFRENMQLLWRCAEEGAGVLVYTNLNDAGGQLCGGWNREMRARGIQVLQMCVRDHATAFNKFTVYGDNYYCWTQNLAAHPITAGLRRIYYPSVNGRWDDCYSAPPLVFDRNWTPLVQGMPTATVISETDRKEVEETEHRTDTTLAAVRSLGRGRLGVLSINPVYTHELGYTKNGQDSECNWGPVDGIILSRGSDGVASDTGKLLLRMYQWLAQNSRTRGFGGYKTGEPIGKGPTAINEDVRNFQPRFNPDDVRMPPSWRHRPEIVKVGETSYVPEVSDPMITGPLHYFKGLIGVHSAASDGGGSVAEYAKAARAAGYSLIAFAENFERLTPQKWQQLVQNCEKNTTADFFCLPGMDIQDRAGNHFILSGVLDMPRRSWLTPDGKRLLMTAYINLTMHSHTVIAHRPAEGPLPPERLKHFQALTVYTYRGKKLVEDASNAYIWQVVNASTPHPVSVHEVFSPAEVAAAAATGYQQIMPSDTIAHAAGYFRGGFGLYYDTPSRHILSEGPTVYDFTVNMKDVGPAEMNREQFRVAIGVRSESPLRQVTLYDGFTPIRRWLPRSPDFHATVDFQHAQQHTLFLRAEDTLGRKALTSCIRNVGHRYVTRCADRQNWLGDAGYIYTGTFLPPRTGAIDIMMPVKGTVEASRLFPDVPGTNMAVKLNFPFTCDDVVLTEAIINEKYIDALWDSGPYKVGFDATASQPSEPSTIYDARMRYYNFTPGSETRPTVSLVEIEIKLKKDVEPLNPGGLFPALGPVPGTRYLWMEGRRQRSGTIGAADILDIPAGGMVGGVVALTPGLQVRNGQFGFAPPPGNPAVIKPGTRWVARYLIPTAPNWQENKPYSFDDRTEEWCRDMGLLGARPYHISLSRGMLEGTTYFAALAPKEQAAAGTVQTTAALPFQVPLRMAGLNERWPVGIWREGSRITYAGVFEGTAWPRLDVSRPGRFYAGNLLRCDDPRVALQVIKWNKDSIRIEAHNPTDATIRTTISTPDEITNYAALRRTVTLEPGTSIAVENTAEPAPHELLSVHIQGVEGDDSMKRRKHDAMKPVS